MAMPTAGLEGPSKTIIVEPVEIPALPDPDRVVEPEREKVDV